MKAKDPIITQDYLRSILDYDPESGIFIWRERSAEMFPNETPRRSSANQAACWNTRYVGRPAGTFRDGEYTIVRIPGHKSQVLAHRLAWFWFYGVWPSGDIDHVSRDKTDNRISNLREATRSQNQINRAHRRDNVLGVRGVCRHSGRYVAQISFNRRHIYIGMYETLEDAKRAYEAEAARLYGDFAR
jgi:hypothetical protein